MSTQYTIPPWASDQSYEQYDIAYGVKVGSTTHSSPYFYATQNNNGQHPSGVFIYSVTASVSADDVVTIQYTQTGNVPSVAPGSIIKVAGTSSVNFTGMAIGGGSGYASYILAGLDATVGAGGTVTMFNPAWTTGYCFIPDYTSKFGSENQSIVTRLGNGYTQRMSRGLNTFDQTPQLIYRNIDKRQTKAIVNYVQDSAGVRAFELLIPDSFIQNNANLKYTATVSDPEPVSFGRYNVNVTVARVFDV